MGTVIRATVRLFAGLVARAVIGVTVIACLLLIVWFFKTNT